MNESTTSLNEDPQPSAEALASLENPSPVLATVARLAVPLVLYGALIVFFQGHNKPGGGFIAGVLAAIAGVIGLLAFGPHQAARFPRWYVPIMCLLMWPISGYCAAAIALVVGLIFHATVGQRTIAQYPWWRMTCVGMIIALVTGIAPLLGGHAFMDHVIWHPDLPVLGKDHLPSATFFDLGVFLIVMGTLTTIFVELGLEGD